MWRLERALFFKMKPNVPPSHTTFFDSSSYCGKKEDVDIYLPPSGKGKQMKNCFLVLFLIQVSRLYDF